MGGFSYSVRNGDRQLRLFFALTFAISWGLGGLCIVAFGKPGYTVGKSTTNPLFFLFFGFAPLFAAIATAAITGGVKEVLDLFARMGRCRVGLRWYAIVVLGLPALALSQAAIVALAGGSVVGYFRPRISLGDRWEQTALYLLAALIGELLGGPLGEEPGWRGYALPRLLIICKPISAAVILGTIWAVWHLPLFFIPGVNQFHMSFVLFAANVLALSVMMTWVFTHTRESVLIAILMHLLINVTENSYHLAVVTTVDWVAAASIIALGGLSGGSANAAPDS